MSNPVFMGHAHKLYGWNECCAALKYLFIYAYLYLWLLKKNYSMPQGTTYRTEVRRNHIN